FKAEGGIRDFHVTGVQTCALPILARAEEHAQFVEVVLAVDRRVQPETGVAERGIVRRGRLRPEIEPVAAVRQRTRPPALDLMQVDALLEDEAAVEQLRLEAAAVAPERV